jgi:hypothetical protein
MVQMSALSVDQNFNSFHCYYYGVNVAAAGTNRNNQGNGVSSFFILPAGSTYNCAMQWGATAFKASSIVPLSSSIFPPQQLRTTIGEAEAAAAVSTLSPPAPSRERPGPELKRLFNAWRVLHGKTRKGQEGSDPINGSEYTRRLANFASFLSMAENMRVDVYNASDPAYTRAVSSMKTKAEAAGQSKVKTKVWDWSLFVIRVRRGVLFLSLSLLSFYFCPRCCLIIVFVFVFVLALALVPALAFFALPALGVVLVNALVVVFESFVLIAIVVAIDCYCYCYCCCYCY